MKIKLNVLMETLLAYMMDKQVLNKGYALIELIISFIIIIFLFIISVPIFKIKGYDYKLFYDYYIYTQSKSMANKNSMLLDIDYTDIQMNSDIIFNEKGNVNQAQTIIINKTIKYTVQLGVGRLVKKK